MRLDRLMMTFVAALGLIIGNGCAYPPAAVQAGNYAYQQALEGRYGQYVAKDPDQMRRLVTREANSLMGCHLDSYEPASLTYVFSDANAKKISDFGEGIWIGIPFCREMFLAHQTEKFLDKIDGNCTSSVDGDALVVRCSEHSKILESLYAPSIASKK